MVETRNISTEILFRVRFCLMWTSPCRVLHYITAKEILLRDEPRITQLLIELYYQKNTEVHNGEWRNPRVGFKLPVFQNKRDQMLRSLRLPAGTFLPVRTLRVQGSVDYIRFSHLTGAIDLGRNMIQIHRSSVKRNLLITRITSIVPSNISL